MVFDCDILDIWKIKQILESERNKGVEYNFGSNSSIVKKAAILIPFVCVEGKWNLLFTRRADTLKSHTGQVSFPGGGMEPGDNNPIETALRETFEEIGLHRENIHVIGSMPNFITISDYLVTPIVSWIDWPIPLNLSDGEVSRVFTIPIDWLQNPENWEEKLYSHPNGFYGSVIFYKLFDGELLWGISAKITVELFRVLENQF